MSALCRMESSLVASSVEYRVLTHPDWRREDGLPLVQILHGAGSSAASLDMLAPVIEGLWEVGELPPAVFACASTPTVGGFYTGAWEAFVAEEFLSHLRTEFGVGKVALFGMSMGGYGALKMAFRHPERYAAVVAIGPAIFPEGASEAHLKGVLGQLYDLVSEDWNDRDPGSLASANAEAIRAAGLAIYLECGDEDVFRLYVGAEALHRRLWDLRIRHEYRSLWGVDHVGPETPERQRAGLRFVGRILSGVAAELPAEMEAWFASGRQGTPPTMDFNAPYGAKLLRKMMGE